MILRPRRRVSPVIPIVAMVDILVITLLFIVATTTFKPKEKKAELAVNLPTASKLGTTAPAQDARRSLTITKERKFFLDGKEVAQQDLVAALKELKASMPTAKLKLEPDGEAPHGLWV